MPKVLIPIKERLFKQRLIGPNPDGTYQDCWNWTGGLWNNGYGRIEYNGKDRRIHRLMYEIENNIQLSTEIQVLHKCDNPKCFNPAHLFLGDPNINCKDKIEKNRHSRGENSNHKLTEDQVREIKIKLKNGVGKWTLALEYDVGYSTIDDIAKNGAWKHVIIE